MKPIVACCAVALLVPVVGLAQEEITGTYYSHANEETMVELPDGGALNRGAYEAFHVTDDPDSPFNQVKGRCIYEDVLSESEEIIMSSGSCLVRNGDGDTYWFWWRRTEGGTEACPISCGTWGIVNGTGIFAGTTGSGTWTTTTLYPDETDAGVWTLKVAKE